MTPLPLLVGSWERHQVSNQFRKSNYLDLFGVTQGTWGRVINPKFKTKTLTHTQKQKL
jgi:hypothetical protein